MALQLAPQTSQYFPALEIFSKYKRSLVDCHIIFHGQVYISNFYNEFLGLPLRIP